MKQYFQFLESLNDRERLMVGVAVVSVAVYLFYLLIYHPFTTQLQEKADRLVVQQSTLQWMRQVQAQAQELKEKKALNNNELLSQLSDELQQDDLQSFPSQLEQSASGDIQLSFNEVPFQWVMDWLKKLDSSYQIEIKRIQVTKGSKPGLVQLSLTLDALS